jgi:pilus assembly protein FimV
MTHGIIRTLLALGLVWYLPGVQALALSELELESALNQPFSARVELLHAQPEEIANLTVQIGDPPSTAGPRLPQLEVKMEEAGNGRHYLWISSREPVREPVMNFVLQLSWPKGRLLKEYSLLLNPR